MSSSHKLDSSLLHFVLAFKVTPCSHTLNSEASYDIWLRDRWAVRGVLVVKLHHEWRRVDLAVIPRNIWQVELPQKALLHGSQEVLHPGVSVFLLQEIFLWQLGVDFPWVLTLDVITERFTGAGADRNHQTQTDLEQERSGAPHSEMRFLLSYWVGTEFTFFLGLRIHFGMARFENGAPQCEGHSPDVRSHAPRVNRGTCVNQNSSVAMLITAIDAFF